MLLASLALIGFGVSDLVRWNPDAVTRWRATLAIAAGSAAVALVTALGGADIGGCLVATIGALIVLAPWATLDLTPKMRLRLKESLATGLSAPPSWPLPP